MKIQRFIIIMIIVTVAGVFLSWTYQKPDIKIYSTLNEIDNSLDTAQSQQDLSMVETLNQFHSTIESIINQAKTYDTQSTISFDEYNAQYATLHRINNDLTNALETTTDRLEKLSTDSNEIVGVQKERLNALGQLNTEISSTLSYLQNFEEMIYTKKASTAKAYLQDLEKHFTQIEKLNNTYTDLSKNYFSLKTNLYHQINK